MTGPPCKVSGPTKPPKCAKVVVGSGAAVGQVVGAGASTPEAGLGLGSGVVVATAEGGGVFSAGRWLAEQAASSRSPTRSPTRSAARGAEPTEGGDTRRRVRIRCVL